MILRLEHIGLGVLALCLSLFVPAASAVHAMPLPVLWIDTDKVTARVSPLHAGLMTEDINPSFDGGLYGEIVRDRALNGSLLKKANALGHWMLIGETTRGSGMALDVSPPLSKAVPTSLRVEATFASPANRVGAANEIAGFCVVPVRPQTGYRVFRRVHWAADSVDRRLRGIVDVRPRRSPALARSLEWIRRA